MARVPETQYAQSGDLSIAYQTIGDGPIDVPLIPGFVSNVELMWEQPRVEALAGPGEVLVTSTVKDLVIGSDLEFDDRAAGAQGVPGEWQLWASV